MVSRNSLTTDRPSIVEVRGSIIIQLRPCMISSTPPTATPTPFAFHLRQEHGSRGEIPVPSYRETPPGARGADNRRGSRRLHEVQRRQALRRAGQMGSSSSAGRGAPTRGLHDRPPRPPEQALGPPLSTSDCSHGTVLSFWALILPDRIELRRLTAWYRPL